MFGMPMARITMAGQRLGVFKRLARAPATAEELAHELATTPEGMQMLLRSLAALGHLDRSQGTYALSKSARKWLDPDSDQYVGTFIEHTSDYWAWWEQLEEVVRTGAGVELHHIPPEDPSWEKYIRGQFELARI